MNDIVFKISLLRLFFCQAIDEWRQEIFNRDLDDRYCCDGRECGCGGATVREMYTTDHKNFQERL